MDNGLLLTTFCFFGHPERFPQLKIAFLHSGASWLPLVLEKAETYLWLMSSTHDVSLEPEEVFFSAIVAHRRQQLGVERGAAT